MEKVAGTLAGILVRKNIVEKEDRDFYRYAIETVLIYAINLITMFVLAAVSGKLLELMLLLATSYPLRTNCGGKHMNTWYSCYIVSCIIMETILLLSGYIKISIAVMTVIMVLCIGCIWLFAPLEHHNHPLEEQDLKKSRIKVRIFSIGVALLAFVFKYFSFETGTAICVSSEVLCSLLLLWGVLEGKRTDI